MEVKGRTCTPAWQAAPARKSETSGLTTWTGTVLWIVAQFVVAAAVVAMCPREMSIRRWKLQIAYKNPNVIIILVA